MANVSCWKETEREVAKAFGTTRAPVCNNLTHSDTFSDVLYIEVKKRKRFWIWGLFEDTKKKALKEKKVPVVAIKQKGRKGFLILIRPEDIKCIAENLK
jgi:hypothetical protein